MVEADAELFHDFRIVNFIPHSARPCLEEFLGVACRQCRYRVGVLAAQLEHFAASGENLEPGARADQV